MKNENGNVLVADPAIAHDAPQTTAPPALARAPGAWFATLGLSATLGVLLLGAIVVIPGVWAIVANTRFLNVLIAGGVVKYHDRHAGFIEGVPSHEYYLASQDPINWMVVGIVLATYLLIASVKSLQLHVIARAYGLRGTFISHARAFVYGQTYRDTTPLALGDAATAAALQASGAPLDRARAVLLTFNTFVLIEIAFFALIGLLGMGWVAWLNQMFWSIVILGGLALWTRAGKRAPDDRLAPAAGAHLAALLQRPLVFGGILALSLAAFGLHDVAAYLTAMAFSTQNVLLNIPPSLMLMAVVGGYIATLIRLTPGGIGQFEWGFAAALFIGGVGLPEAATVAILVSVLRYTALLIVYLLTFSARSSRVGFQQVTSLAASNEWQRAGALAPTGAIERPLPLPSRPVPAPADLWGRAVAVAGVALLVFFLDRLAALLSDMWLLQSLGLAQIFAVNLTTMAILFITALVLFGAAISIPALLYDIPRRLRRALLGLAALTSLLAGYWLAGHYLEILSWNGVPFGQADPVFGIDIGFYVFTLPGLWVMWTTLAWALVAALGAAITCAAVANRGIGAAGSRLAFWVGTLATPFAQAILACLGIVAAFGIWLSRFDLLVKDNYESSVFTGAEYVDVEGFFSTLNQINFTALAAIAITIALIVMLRALRSGARSGAAAWNGRARGAGIACLAILGADFAFAGAVAIRDTTLVTPNQPVVQLPYIDRHIKATRAAYGFDRVEVVDLLPRGDDDPLPDVDRLLNSPTVRNAPLWPTYVTYLERLVDPQHANRVLQTGGETMIYGPTLEIFKQQQKLRTYYDFLDVDPLRFELNGELRVFASAVRELPILEPQPWLAWWGQRFMLFTHGHGLVMAPISEVNTEGEPRFASYEIPVQTRWPELTVNSQQIYYGEGSASMAVSNVRNLAEFDFPTDQGRAENILPLDLPTGVPVDSPLKRLVFGWKSGEFFPMLFSSLIGNETRVHYDRQPLNRLKHVAPFLYFDANTYATVADGQIYWMANGMTTSDRYPYSAFGDIGDKSISRTRESVDALRINYVEDSVKATINAQTGQVQLYKISNAPVIEMWSRVYPGLFIDGAQMPAPIRQQMTYPMHLFHLQFDDLYIYYHMDDPVYFFNMEDMWDDSDEVLGPVLEGGRGITFSIEPQPIVLETGGMLPASSRPAQFSLVSAFTPEGARNLRAVPIAYQDGDDYGRLIVLQVPKGKYVVGPEQADSIIDQDPEISQQISWWNRMGNQVIRGHTSLMLIDNEVFYIEPIFIRSQQNAVSQLRRVVTVFRGQAYMAETLEDAIRLAVDSHAEKLAEAQQ
jgi:hypothetical protein